MTEKLESPGCPLAMAHTSGTVPTVGLPQNHFKLTNLMVAEHFQHIEFYIFKKEILAEFLYWATLQSPYTLPYLTLKSRALNEYLEPHFDDNDDIPQKFTYEKLNDLISRSALLSIPHIRKLNEPRISSGTEYENRYETESKNPDFDFISIGALSRNMFFSIIKRHIMDSDDVQPDIKNYTISLIDSWVKS